MEWNSLWKCVLRLTFRQWLAGFWVQKEVAKNSHSGHSSQAQWKESERDVSFGLAHNGHGMRWNTFGNLLWVRLRSMRFLAFSFPSRQSIVIPPDVSTVSPLSNVSSLNILVLRWISIWCTDHQIACDSARVSCRRELISCLILLIAHHPIPEQQSILRVISR
jgi:hypothetical protein